MRELFSSVVRGLRGRVNRFQGSAASAFEGVAGVRGLYLQIPHWKRVTRYAFATAALVVLGLMAIGAGAPRSTAQTELAGVYGRVTDPSGAIIVDAEVEIKNTETGISTTVKTNQNGLYTIPSLHPGQYLINVRKPGFQSVTVTELTLNVQDNVVRNFALQVGSMAETVTVHADDVHINTRDASVSTVIDRDFVSSLPLNGRSFNTLLQLTPGVIIAPTNGFSSGQFSVAGQRTNANNFSVDGASGNFGVSAINIGQSGTGAAPAFSAVGGTSSLVSADALQEFRIETSSFAPEFGKTPGGQVILTTRSGTADLHGGIYEYFRNTVMDANDWFANQADLPRAPEHHNDFGGFLGGPLRKNRTFFFFSYEGARLDEPQTQMIQVPSAYARNAASQALRPYLNAYPQPDDKTIVSGVYTSKFTGNYSNRGTLDASSLRIDHRFNDRVSLFGRYNYAPSKNIDRLDSLSELVKIAVDTQTLTLGLNMLWGAGLFDALRINYSSQTANQINSMDSFGGATPFNPAILLGALSSASNLASFYSFDIRQFAVGPVTKAKTSQVNILNDFGVTHGLHQFKFGVDYRGIFLDVGSFQHSLNFLSSDVQSAVVNDSASLQGISKTFPRLLATSFGAYGQDTWKATKRLTVTYGVRWELSPAPSARGTTRLAAWNDLSNPAELALAPQGTPLWGTRYTSFAPRIGGAYSLTEMGDFVLRAGVGIFYDLGVGSAGDAAGRFPNSIALNAPDVPFSTSDFVGFLPAISAQPPYPIGISVFARNLSMPRSHQWNVALEKSFLNVQAVSLTYIGQVGRDLLRNEALPQPNTNFAGDALATVNHATSDYSGLQVQYRVRTKKVQTLLNYSWSHSIDNASDDSIASVGLSNAIISAANDRGNSNFDVRHSFSGAVTYAIPTFTRVRSLAMVARDWSAEAIVVARSGLPFNAVVYSTSPDQTGYATSRPDIVPGQPFWISKPGAPGGKALNSSLDPVTGTIIGGAFVIPSTVRQGTEGRNNIPGFGLTQMDVSLGRTFSITEGVKLQFRADAFNVLNHPNFSNPLGFIEGGDPYLQSQTMINQRLGAQGLNALFSEGGPRSLQLSLRVDF